MLKVQEKLFFRSNVRKLILAILILGNIIYHIWIFARPSAITDVKSYGYLEHWTFQIYLFIYYFVLVLFLAYDYFRELPDAEYLDVVKVSRNAGKHDLMQVIVMEQWVLLSAVIFLCFFFFGFALSETLTWELTGYLFRFVFIYVVLNGNVAIILALLLSRTVGKLLGYICVILFACMVSPIATSNIGFLSFFFKEIHDMWKMFLIMPEGTDQAFPGTLLPVNFTMIARPLFWIILCSTALLMLSKIKYRKRIAVLFGLLLIFDCVCADLPYSCYSVNDSFGQSDSGAYDQMTYMIEGSLEAKEESGFEVARYEMELEMGRDMKASVSVFPENKGLAEYRMTLYHLYEVEKVLDDKGTELQFDRNGDYLTIYNPSENLTEICVIYNGCLSNFYANSKMIYLPGWFAYYPLPGYKTIYQDYKYADNRFEEKIDFDIKVDAENKVYSDLPRLEGNHFTGECYGATLVSGFYKEEVLDHGIRYIYPYLDKTSWTDAEVTKEYYEDVSGILSEMWAEEEEKTIIILPVTSTGRDSLRPGSLIGVYSWRYFADNMEDTGNLLGIRDELEIDEDEMIELLLTYYELMETDSPELLTYDSLKQEWDNIRKAHDLQPSTDDDFKALIVVYLGQEVWSSLSE